MAEFKEISPNAPLVAKVANWFDNRFPTAFEAYRKHMSEYYASGTSSARWRCWCWLSKSSRAFFW